MTEFEKEGSKGQDSIKFLFERLKKYDHKVTPEAVLKTLETLKDRMASLSVFLLHEKGFNEDGNKYSDATIALEENGEVFFRVDPWHGEFKETVDPLCWILSFPDRIFSRPIKAIVPPEIFTDIKEIAYFMNEPRKENMRDGQRFQDEKLCLALIQKVKDFCTDQNP